MANPNPTSTLREVSHITKFNGSNFYDWKYEFLGIMEQCGLKNLIEVADGQQLCSIPATVRLLFHRTHSLLHLSREHK